MYAISPSCPRSCGTSSLPTASVRHLEVLSTGPGRVMLVLITDTGRVEQRVVEVPVLTSEDLLPDLRARLNAAMDGKRLAAADAAVAELARQMPLPSNP